MGVRNFVVTFWGLRSVPLDFLGVWFYPYSTLASFASPHHYYSLVPRCLVPSVAPGVLYPQDITLDQFFFDREI